MTLRLNGATSGYTEIDAPAVAGSNTLVLPGGNGTAGQVLTTNGSGALSWTGMGPAFSAFQNSQQSLTANTWTLGVFQAEDFDTANCYSTSTYAFTPNVAGYYLVTGGFQIASTSTALLTQFYKNGSAYKTTNWLGSASAAYGSVLVYLNGATDYMQLYFYSSVTQNTTASAVVTYFQGHFVRPA